MNQRKAREIRKIAENQTNDKALRRRIYRVTKRLYNKTPVNKRNDFIRALKNYSILRAAQQETK
jgi:hypothetical protein